MKIYNRRNLQLVEFWVHSPYPYWWDGRSFIESPVGNRFIKGKFKSTSNIAHTNETNFDQIIRKALVAKIKSGRHNHVYFSTIHKLKYKYNGRNRLFSDYEYGMIDV